MKKLIVIAIAVLLFSSAFAILASTVKATVLPDYIAVKDAVEPKSTNVVIEDPMVPDPTPYYDIGNVATWIYANFYSGAYSTRIFKLAGISAHAEIWTSNTGSPLYADLYSWPSGDLRPTPIVTTAQINFLLNEFETVIYPTNIAYFGAPVVRDGHAAAYGPPGYYSGSSRIVILIMNIRDQNYYDSTYPYYVAGYFSSTVGYYTDRNVVTLDCYQWERRLGPMGTVWPPPAPPYPGGVDHLYVYDSTLAHEFQHLIHNDWNPSDPSWMNEGASMFAEYLNGFGIDPSYINSYFYTPDNSLTEWGDQGDINILADYGESALFAMYLADHYGGAGIISYFVQGGVPDVAGLNLALAHFGYTDRFADVYRNFKLANLIRADTPGGGKYNYHNINLNDPSIIPIRMAGEKTGSFPWTRASTEFGTTKTILGYDTGMSLLPQFGSDYINLSSIGSNAVWFDGDLTGVMPASTGDWTYDTTNSWWYAGATDLLNTIVGDEVYVNPAGTKTLTLVTAWALELYWDFGFVQVSTDNGKTWTSLIDNQGYATTVHDPSAHPDVVANLPGLTDVNNNWWVGSYNALSYTGSPIAGDWETLTFNLNAYSGQTVLIGFRCVTDWATTYEGWFIQSATVDTPLTLQLIPLPNAPATFQVDWVVWDEALGAHVFPLDSLNNGTITPFPGDWTTNFDVILVVTSTADGALNSPFIIGLEDYEFQVQAPPVVVGGIWAPQTVFTANDAPSVWLGLVPTLVLTTASVIIVRYRKKKHE